MNEVVADRARISPGDRVLDAGCGVGGAPIWLANARGATVCGVNIQPMHLEIARRSAASTRAAENISFFQRDYADTGFPDDSFDVVWGLESICHCRDKRAFLQEAQRVLKPGGRLIVADFFLHKASLTEDEEQSMQLWLDGWAIPHLAEINGFRRVLQELGYENVDYRDITQNVMPSSRRIHEASRWTYAVGRLLDRLGLRTSVQTRNMRAAYFQYETIQAGLWGYGMFYAEKVKE